MTIEVDGGLETLELTLPRGRYPLDLRLSAPRYVTLPMMMKAKKETRKKLSKAETFGVDLKKNMLSSLDCFEAPESKKSRGNASGNVDELIDRLKMKLKFYKEAEDGSFNHR